MPCVVNNLVVLVINRNYTQIHPYTHLTVAMKAEATSLHVSISVEIQA